MREGRALSVGLVGNCGDVLPEIVRRGVQVDVVTDQTSAHDPLNGYIPQGLTLTEAAELRQRDPEEYVRRSTATMVVHVNAMLALAAGRRGGLRLRQQHSPLCFRRRLRGRVSDSRLCAGVHSAAVLHRARGRSAGLRFRATRRTSTAPTNWRWSCFPENEILTRWLRLARGPFRFPGTCRRASAGWAMASARGWALAINELVRKGEISAPIAIGRDHLDTGSVASPYRETEKMLDGSDAVADWPILNALLNTASGATWVSFHHGGGVGMGYSLHAGQVTVADGTEMAARKIARVLNNDPGLGVVRHADAGYELAQRTARGTGHSDADGGKVDGEPDSLAVVNIGQLVTLAGPERPRVGAELRELGLIADAALLVEDGRIAAAGTYAELRSVIPAEATVIDARGLLRYAGICGCAYASCFCRQSRGGV